uniref:glutathione synthetase-like n=1 Tax=Myxine glutinosa TaxID=7769 RepID=UPI00358FDE9B
MSSDQSEMALQDLIPNSILEDHDLLASLVSDATDFALSQGILSRIKDVPQNPQVATFIPFMLFPSIVPRPLFEQVLAIQTDFNLMVDQVSQDFCFLERCLRSTVQADEFIGRLFALYEEMKVDGITK